MSEITQPPEVPLILSVSGARGIVGTSMTPSVAAAFAAAFGSFVKATTGRADPVFCLGRDSRPSGEMLAAAAAAGLASIGGRVIELGVVTTPTAAVMIGHHRAEGGMVITASHNPIIWNGLKCLNADGGAPPKRDVDEIIRRFREREVDYAAVEDLQSSKRDKSSHETHVAKVLAHIDSASIRAGQFKVVLDSVNGAGCAAGRMLLDELGCEVIHLNGEPTGLFSHTPEPIEENLTELAALTRSFRAVCGFAQDPDADRLAIVDENGRYIGEEYTLVLAAKRLLDLRAAAGETGEVVLAANLSTSRMIDDLAGRYENVKVVRTPVGEANVAEAMKTPAPGRGPGQAYGSRTGPTSGGALVGGEGNGGLIFPPVCWVRDSLTAMALVLGLLADDPRKRPLSEIVDEMPRYCMIKRKQPLASPDAAAGILKNVPSTFSGARIDTSDGVRLDFDDGWVHLRPSNTEPIIRLIAEAQTTERAEALIAQVSSAAGLA
jgi:phosphomannomutase